jgi:hypothetical protein
MIRMSRFALLFIMLLSACGPAVLPTEYAVVTPTVTPRPTLKPLATATSQNPGLAVPTIEPPSPPDFGSLPTGQLEDYRLKSLKASDIWALIEADAPVFPFNDADQGYDWNGDWGTVKLTLLREIKARYPNSLDAAMADAELISPGTYFYVSTPVESTIEPFRKALEAALNTEPTLAISPEILEKYVALILPIVYTAEFFPAPNVLGDDQPGWILGIRGGGYASAFVLSGVAGHYRLVSPDRNWRTIYWGEQSVGIYDLNANGIPEVGIHDSYWGTGMSHYCEENLNVYEWQGDRFVNLTPGLSTSAGTDGGGCLDFQFEEGPNGIQSITTGNWIASYCSTDNAVNIGSPDIVRRYEWNGVFFELADVEISPMETSMWEGAPLHCRLNWVNEVGVTNDQAFNLLPTLLADNDPEHVAGYIDNFGPAYLDFFNFKLGTWYAMRGQQTRALALLTQVRDNPANNNYDTASKLAAAFLQTYPEQSPYASCLLTNEVISIYDYRSGDYLDIVAMEEEWGFSDPQWMFGGGYAVLFNGTGAREDTPNICNLSSAFALMVRRQVFTGGSELADWLKMQRIPYTGLIEKDVNQDGLRDWIVALGTGRSQSLDLWVLLNKGNFIQPLFVEDLGIPMTNLPVAFDTFQPHSSAPMLNVYLSPDDFLVFQVIGNGENVGIHNLPVKYNWDQSYLGFTIQPASTDFEQEGAQELFIEKSGEGLSWQDDWEVYRWDSSFNTLTLSSYPEFEQEQQILGVENILFNHAKPLDAITTLNQLLSNEYDLLDTQMDAYNSLPIVRPYLLYLLGLAYEMSENQEGAVDTYWALWNEYPLHPLSYVVQQRMHNTKEGEEK